MHNGQQRSTWQQLCNNNNNLQQFEQLTDNEQHATDNNVATTTTTTDSQQRLWYHQWIVRGSVMADHAPGRRCCQYPPDPPVMSLGTPFLRVRASSHGCCLNFCIPVAPSAPLAHNRLAFVQQRTTTTTTTGWQRRCHHWGGLHRWHLKGESARLQFQPPRWSEGQARPGVLAFQL